MERSGAAMSIDPAETSGKRLELWWIIPFAKAVESPLLRLAIYFVAVLILGVGWKGDFPLDDAYITMHNARSAMQGWDATYAVSPVAGATSLAHLALMIGLGMFMPLPYAAMTICLLAAIAYTVGLDMLVRNAGARTWQVPLLTLVGLLVGTMPISMANGLETSLACATATWLLLLKRRLPVLAGLAPFIRPELAILASLSLLRTLWTASNSKRLKTVAVAAATALPFVLWSYFETGQLLPSTLAAKIAFFHEGQWPVIRRIAALDDALVSSNFLILVPGLVVLRDWRAWGYLGAVIAALLIVLPGAFEWNSARYLGPLVPVAILGYAQGSHLRLGSFIVAFLAAFLAFGLPGRTAELDRNRAWSRAQATALHATLGSLSAGSRILIHDAGIAAWTAPQMRLIDVVGLKTPSSIAPHQAMTKAACQWGQALGSIARSSGARYALVLERPFWRCVRTNLVDAGWTFVPMPSHGGAYKLYAISPP